MSVQLSFRGLLAPVSVFVSVGIASASLGQSPYAIEVVEYLPGVGVPAGYDVPESALGAPSRFTDDPLFPSAVTPFSSAYLPAQVCGVGGGGHLVIAFESPVVDDPVNPFGIDLLIFGNSFFIDAAYPAGVVGSFFGDGGVVEVSADGKAWFEVAEVDADGLFPTLGYEDVGPYPTLPGNVPTDFTRPVDPMLGPLLVGMTHEQVVAAYAGSGGGAGIDLASVGLPEVSFVRVSLPAGSGFTIEIDAASDVSPPAADPDLDGDGAIGGGDLTILLASWGESGANIPADLDGDGAVGGSDLTILLSNWNLEG